MTTDVASEGRMKLSCLEAVYESEYPRLWRALLAWTGSREIADDAAAEAFAQAATRDDLRDPAAWIWRVGFRLARRELGRERSLVPMDELPGRRPMNTERDEASLSAATVDLLTSLRRLTEQQRASVVLTDGFGFRSAEAASLLGTTATTVRVQALRARRRLRQELSTLERESDG
jgi:RNA polymerase sigma factor (sigma-70 family)